MTLDESNKKTINYRLTHLTALLLVFILLLFAGCRFNDVVKDGSVEEISKALKNGADPNEMSSGETPLINAIQYNKNPYEASLVLIKNGADVNMPDENSTTPLLASIRIKNPDEAYRLTELLLIHKANVNRDGGFNKITPVMGASTRRDGTKIVELLIKNGADIKAQDVKRETALHYACGTNGNTEMIELLIKHGADVNAGSPANTPLHRAAYIGAAKNIKILINHNALINVKDITSEAKTPLELAVDHKQFETARELIENGADINTTSYYNYQPFRYRNNTQSYLDKLVKVDLNTIRFERMYLRAKIKQVMCI